MTRSGLNRFADGEEGAKGIIHRIGVREVSGLGLPGSKSGSVHAFCVFRPKTPIEYQTI
jgi:hypothetical protein